MRQEGNCRIGEREWREMGDGRESRLPTARQRLRNAWSFCSAVPTASANSTESGGVLPPTIAARFMFGIDTRQRQTADIASVLRSNRSHLSCPPLSLLRFPSRPLSSPALKLAVNGCVGDVTTRVCTPHRDAPALPGNAAVRTSGAPGVDLSRTKEAISIDVGAGNGSDPVERWKRQTPEDLSFPAATRQGRALLS